MTFDSLLFLFYFLPAALILYYIVPRRFGGIPLLLSSLVFYAWGSPVYLLLMAFSVLFNYSGGILICSYRDKEQVLAAKISLIVIISVNVLILLFFKYFGALISAINTISGLALRAPELPLPLGISFFTLSVLSYVLDVYRNQVEMQKNLLDFALYVSFFPKVTAGPIVKYQDMALQLRERKMAPAKFGAGLSLFLVGLFKKVLIADNLGTVFSAISGLDTMSAGTAWLGMILYSLQLYFDFSGYSDMAIGLAKLFGFDFDKNFDYPYLSAGISEFWRRWHISLGAWFKEYVYAPLGSDHCSLKRQILNIGIVWLLIGLWHGAGLHFLVWGLYQGILIILELRVLEKLWSKLPTILRIIVNTLLVWLGWVLFFSPSVSAAIHYYGQMFGAGHMGFLDTSFRYYLSSCIWYLIPALIGIGPVVHRIHGRLAYWKGGAITYLSVLFYILAFLLCIVFLTSGTSPFLCAQF